jgi:hypothetical protein
VRGRARTPGWQVSYDDAGHHEWHGDEPDRWGDPYTVTAAERQAHRDATVSLFYYRPPAIGVARVSQPSRRRRRRRRVEHAPEMEE